jgi:23S rRNA (uracil1939-C5)-methyltransferase
MLSPGQEVELLVEKPAVGGRMIARHARQVVFVLGAIPGERVRARINRVERQLAFATVVDVLDASPDRRAPAGDPLCGGCLYAHVAYPRQLTIKSEVILDAFARLGQIVLPEPATIAGSPERGYRMRARLHVDKGRAGFYREGTHAFCDAAETGQLTRAGLEAVGSVVSSLTRAGVNASSVELGENMPADERALLIESAAPVALAEDALAEAAAAAGVSGCILTSPAGTVTAGTPAVADDLAALTRGRASGGRLCRHAGSFFQSNRFLLPDLVAAVLDAVPPAGDVLDLYAGVGLFSVALAALGRRGITAVEGDRSSSADLGRNAGRFGSAIRVVSSSVEDHVRRAAGSRPEGIIVDPPRMGISRQAIEAIARSGAGRIIYVSCDPATMARDARRLLQAGYALRSLAGFDLFPNTPHVESLGVFELHR